MNAEFYLVCQHPDGGFTAIPGYDIDGPDPEPLTSDWRFPNIASAVSWAESMLPENGVRIHNDLEEVILEEPEPEEDWVEVSEYSVKGLEDYTNQALDAFARQNPEELDASLNMQSLLLSAWDEAMQADDDLLDDTMGLDEPVSAPWDPYVEAITVSEGEDAIRSLRDSALRIRLRAASLTDSMGADAEYVKGMRRAAAIIDHDAEQKERGGAPLSITDSVTDGPHAGMSTAEINESYKRLSQNPYLSDETRVALALVEAVLALIEDNAEKDQADTP